MAAGELKGRPELPPVAAPRPRPRARTSGLPRQRRTTGWESRSRDKALKTLRRYAVEVVQWISRLRPASRTVPLAHFTQSAAFLCLRALGLSLASITIGPGYVQPQQNAGAVF